MKNIFKSSDPCKSCEVYKQIGCSHVDGYLCDFPSCSILEDFLQDNKSTYTCKFPDKYKDRGSK